MRIVTCLVLMLFCVPAFLGCKQESSPPIIESPADDPAATDPVVTDPAADDEYVADPEVDATDDDDYADE